MASAAGAALAAGSALVTGSALVATAGAAFTSTAGAAGSAFALAAFFAAGFSALTGSAAFTAGAVGFSSAFLVVRGLRAAGFWAGATSLAGAAVVSAAGAASSTLAARFTRSFTSEMTHSWSPPPGTSCQICSTAPTSAPMPTVSTHLPPAQEERRRTVPSGVCSTFHIWDVPPTSSHRCSQVPLAVPVMVRSSNLPEARLRMRYTPSPSRTKLHSCSGLWSYLPRRTVPPSLLPSTA